MEKPGLNIIIIIKDLPTLEDNTIRMDVAHITIK